MNNREKVLLTTMGLLTENESPDYKKIFQNYCKDRITNLGKVELPDAIWEDEMNTWDIVMTADTIREFSDLRIINNIELNEEDNLIAIDKDNKIVFNTPMLTSIGYAARMEFDKIDEKYYDNLMKYWDDINFEEWMEGYVDESAKLNEDYDDIDFGEYTRLINEIKIQAEENGYNLSDEDVKKIADEMVDVDKFFYDYELPDPDDIDNEDWEEIHNVINDYLKASKKEESNEIYDNNYVIDYVVPNYTGGGVYEYIGKLADGNYFMAFDDYFSVENTMFDIRIVDTNPEDAIEDYGYADWQDLHIVKDLNEIEAKEFTIKALNWIINNVPDGNYDINDMKNRLDVIYN